MTDPRVSGGDGAPASGGKSAIQRSIAFAALFAVVIYTVLLWPYARGLWWLHVHPQPAPALLIPVAGVSAEKLEANFGAPRRDHIHEGIDIMSPAATPVLATASGVVIGNRSTPIGGIVLWILGAGRRLYYYAHMRELAPGMHMGRYIEAGTQIGTVGNTGNAATTPPHLHFAIYEVTSSFYPLRYHPIDPYPLLTH